MTKTPKRKPVTNTTAHKLERLIAAQIALVRSAERSKEEQAAIRERKLVLGGLTGDDRRWARYICGTLDGMLEAGTTSRP